MSFTFLIGQDVQWMGTVWTVLRTECERVAEVECRYYVIAPVDEPEHHERIRDYLLNLEAIACRSPEGMVQPAGASLGHGNRRDTGRCASRGEVVPRSGYYGVVLDPRSSPNFPYRARAKTEGRVVNLGNYATAEDAARAYDRYALAHMDDCVRPLNFAI